MARAPAGAFGDGGLELGVVTGAHGLRGVLRVRLWGEGSVLPEPGAEVHLLRGEHLVHRGRLQRAAPVPGRPLARIEVAGVTGRDAALALRGARVCVSRDQMPPLGDGDFFLADTVGKPVRGTVGGRMRGDLGRVVGVVDGGPRPLLEVTSELGERWFLLPSTAYVREVTADAVVVDLPEGMGPEDASPGRRGR